MITSGVFCETDFVKCLVKRMQQLGAMDGHFSRPHDRCTSPQKLQVVQGVSQVHTGGILFLTHIRLIGKARKFRAVADNAACRMTNG